MTNSPDSSATPEVPETKPDPAAYSDFKQFYIDYVRWTRVHQPDSLSAKMFPLDRFIVEFPEGLKQDEVNTALLQFMAGDALQEMAASIGIEPDDDRFAFARARIAALAAQNPTNEDISRIISSDMHHHGHGHSHDYTPYTPDSVKSGIGATSHSPEFRREKSRDEIREALFEHIRALVGDVVDSKLPVPQMRASLAESRKGIDPLAAFDPKFAEELTRHVDHAELIADLLDDEVTTPGEYAAIMNTLVADLVSDHEKMNDEELAKHKDHDPEDCAALKHGFKPYQIIYSRIFSEDPQVDNRLKESPDVMVVVLDASDSSINPTVIALHPALGQQKLEDLEAATHHAGKTYMEMLKAHVSAHPEVAMMAFMNGSQTYQHLVESGMAPPVLPRELEEGEHVHAAALSIDNASVSPSLDNLKAAITAVKGSFNEDPSVVFADIKPEDFFTGSGESPSE